ncbi:DinB family protein [Paractinoplanes rishiriensis]|uniref:DinB-like domain-containing protein n=1 Tax=Paractinoplanes rishiriensis TaxID=1050105 RepID=A0A919MX19_9ACTN|nr:DinB family protein [Actinoplanes rishiriensis]GIE98438.1 hypothetical protein Ari01nite_59030 [Actinoplanes rishiriensis]
MTDLTWNDQLRDQLDWHWTKQLRPRLDGLTDDEYFWEPVPGSWNVHPQATGPPTIDFAFPEPDPPPVTTISWRLAHVIVGVLAMRSASHFGREKTNYEIFPYAATAADALAQLDTEYAAWLAGVKSLGEEGLARPCGPAEGAYADYPMAALVLHINREMIHHLAEVCLLRDLRLERN